MKIVLFGVFAVVCGLFISLIVLTGIAGFASLVFPYASLVPFEGTRVTWQSVPPQALILIFLAWSSAGYLGAATASWIAVSGTKKTASWIVSGLLFAGAVIVLSIVPQPMWFIALTAVLLLLFSVAGMRLGSRISAPI